MGRKRKVIILAVGFIQRYYVQPLIKSKLRTFEITKLLLDGVDAIEYRFPDGKALFSEIEKVSPKFIKNPKDLISPVRDSEGNYVSFDNDIQWEVSPKYNQQTGQ